MKRTQSGTQEYSKKNILNNWLLVIYTFRRTIKNKTLVITSKNYLNKTTNNKK